LISKQAPKLLAQISHKKRHKSSSRKLSARDDEIRVGFSLTEEVRERLMRDRRGFLEALRDQIETAMRVCGNKCPANDSTRDVELATWECA
jgi:hypothetical protein